MAQYIEGDYFDVDYFTGDIETQYPVATRVVIDRSVILDGVDVTEYLTSLEISQQLGTPYNSLSMELSGYYLNPTFIRNKNKRVLVTIGSDIYSFIIIDSDQTYKNNITILGKTQGCLLDKPFTPESNISEIGTSNEVIANLCQPNGVSLSNDIANFGFGKGSFAMFGTSQEAIRRIVDVAGGDIYEINGQLRIEQKFRIPQGSHVDFVIPDSILTDKEVVEDFGGSPLVNTVVFNSRTNDIYSEPKITMLIPKIGRPFFIFNPIPVEVGQINSNLGSFNFTDKVITYEGVINDEKVIYVDGGIKSVNSVKVNGTDVPYSVEIGHNVLVLNNSASGIIKISYITDAVVSYTHNGFYNGVDRTRTYKVQYLNQLLDESINVPKPENSGDTDVPYNSAGDICVVEIDQNITKTAPVKFRVSTGSLTNLMFILDNSVATNVLSEHPPIGLAGGFDYNFATGVTKATSTMSTTTSATIEDLGYGGTRYGFYLPNGITPTGFKVGSQEVAFSTSLGHGSVTQYYISDSSKIGIGVTVSFDTDVDEYTIPACGEDNAVKTFDIYSCGGVTTGTYPVGDEITSCAIPQTVTVNVSTVLDVPSSTTIGKSITVTEGGSGSFVVDKYGKIYVPIATPGKITLDCSAVSTGREIYIDSTNAGG